MRIGNKLLAENKSAFIIAEIGINHNGDLRIAMEMIDAIAKAGADCVKFQTFSSEEFINDKAELFEYTSQGIKVKESMYEMFKRNELDRNEFDKLFSYSRDLGLIPLSTPTDRNAVDLLDDLGVEAFKIGSDDLVYTPFIHYVAMKNKPIILSTGMANEDEIKRAIATIKESGNDKIALLHCVSEYPTPPGNVNLRKINKLKSTFKVPVGFSDHSYGFTAALGSVAMGACIIEKHFTLDRNMKGPDHHFSADPSELAEMVRRIRELELNFGHDKLVPTKAEKEMALLARRSIVTKNDIKAGKILTFEDFSFKRPGSGMMPYEVDKIIGKFAASDIKKGVLIQLSMLRN